MDDLRTFRPAPDSAPLEERLAAFPFVALLSTAGREVLLNSSKPMRFAQGTPLLTAGDGCSAMLLVERGAIRVFKRTESGREILLYRVAPGESCVLGTTCLLRGSSYPAEAEAQPGTVALGLDATAFRTLYESEAGMRRFVTDLYALRLEELMLLVEEVAFRKMDERLAAFLLREARVDAGWRPVERSHEELAAELGTAREVVSRLLNQLAEAGIVALERRRVRLLDPERLAREAGAEK